MAIDERKRAAIEFSLYWESSRAAHNDRFFIDNIDFWRDIFPGKMGDACAGSTPGQRHGETFAPGTLVPEHAEKNIVTFKKSQLDFALKLPPHTFEEGRFYPKGYFWKPLQSFPADRTPVRLVHHEGASMSVDTNHPLSRYQLSVSARIHRTRSITAQRGGSLHDIAEEITAHGPGMQTPENRSEDWAATASLLTRDDSDDAHYYRSPRLVQHLDKTAREQVQSLYARLLTPQTRILDLMSSWESHLPESLASCRVEGLGMNEQELQANSRLAGYLIHDLNNDPVLPYPENSFDAAVCTVSIEYLCRPLDVLAELARVLRPGGMLLITVSERWFPGKQVHGWAELHPFERQGLIGNYLLSLGCFEHLQTESVRGYPRPADDKYRHQLSMSDPLYFIWATSR